jgi:cell division protein FtsW
MTRSSIAQMSLAERRVRALYRLGTADKRKVFMRAPTRAFYAIVLITTGLTMLGIVMVMSSSTIAMFHDGQSPWTLVHKQLLWALIGVVLAWIVYRLEYRRVRRLVKPILLGAFAVNFLPFVPGVGAEVNGARAWAGWGDFRFQPSEILKLAVVLFCADLISSRHRRIADHREVLYPMGAVMGSAALICAAQKDFGSATIMALVVLAMCFIAGVPRIQITLVAGALGAAALFLFASSTTVRSRFGAFLDLTGTKDFEGYQVWQSLLSVANGGITGVGIGQGSGKWGYVPLAYSDFIFSTVAEEMGMIGTAAVLGGFGALVYLGIRIALAARDMFGALLAGGIVSWLGIQALVNIGGVTGALPMTGLTLPFISYGGSSLSVSIVAVALVLNVARHGKTT